MLTQTQTVETATELTPKQIARLKIELQVYKGLMLEQQELAEALAAMKAQLDSIRQEVGDKTIALPGFGSVTDVSGGTTRSLNKKKVYALGITPAALEDCYTEKPKRGHVLVTVPGLKDNKKETEE